MEGSKNINALPVPLLRQVFFALFGCPFPFRVLGSFLEGPWGALLSPLGCIWAPFGRSFWLIFGVKKTIENRDLPNRSARSRFSSPGALKELLG